MELAKAVEKIEGEVDQIVHFNESTGFFIGVLLTGAKNAKVLGTSFDGNMPPIGCVMAATGTWEDNKNPRFSEKIFKVKDYSLSMPKCGQGVVKLLTALKGIGDIRAHKIVDRLGDKALEAIVANHECIIGLGGIGDAVAKRVSEELRALGSDADALKLLADIGLGPKVRNFIVDEFGGEKVVEMINEDPYILVNMGKISFKKMDKFALATGRVAATSVRRGAAVVRETLRLHCEWGHTFASRDQIIKAAKALKLATPISDPRAIDAGIKYAIEQQAIVEVGHDRVALKDLAEAENTIASILTDWSSKPSKLGSLRILSEENTTLTAEQQQAVTNAVNHRVSVVTGGPGTGKTFVSKSILEAMRGSTTFIVAPTGKAACRANQLTGCEASTIHRFIGKINSELDSKKEIQPDPDQVIPQVTLVDEASMVDTELFSRLLATLNLRSNPRLIVVGDSNQLPSIGPGRVLADLIESNAIPVVKLTQIQRQKGDSNIISNAYAINSAEAGEKFELREAADFVVVEHQKPEMLRKQMLDYVVKLKNDGVDIINQMQVLSGQRKNTLGTDELNEAIRELVNPAWPSKPEYKGKFGDSFRVGDKVMVTKNDYTLGVVNGDQGVVTMIQQADKDHKGSVTIQLTGINGTEVTFEDDDVEMLVQAWAITTHKSQGSEYPIALVVCHKQLAWALQRALLYTAVTRGKEKVVIFGTHEDINQAAINETPMRYTRLGQMLYSNKSNKEL